MSCLFVIQGIFETHINATSRKNNAEVRKNQPFSNLQSKF